MIMLHRGKAPARPNAVKFKYRTYFNAQALPVPPQRFGHYGDVINWGMLGNDTAGNCVEAGADHETMLFLAESNRPPGGFTDTTALADYSAITGYSRWNPLSDQGTDLVVAADYRRKTGLVDSAGVRHKIDAYVALRTGNVADLVLAAYLTSAVGVGIAMPAGAEDDFLAGRVWSDTSGDPADGHYVPCVGRNGAGNLLVVTWGRLHAMTPAYYAKYNDESLAYVSLEALDAKGLSPEQFNKAQIQMDLAAL